MHFFGQSPKKFGKVLIYIYILASAFLHRVQAEKRAYNTMCQLFAIPLPTFAGLWCVCS